MNVVYAGNLGLSHPLETFGRLIEQLSDRTKLRLVGAGLSESGEVRLRAICRRAGIDPELHPRLPFVKLGSLFKEYDIDLGVILLSDESAGLVSPSKYAAYLKYGLPTLYIGPEGTNSQAICSRFAAGFELRNGASEAELRQVVDALLDGGVLEQRRRNVEFAARYFNAVGGETLYQQLAWNWFAAGTLPVPIACYSEMEKRQEACPPTGENNQ